MESAGHLGFDGLLGFLPGFLPLLGFFLAASVTTSSRSSRTTRWCHRMLKSLPGLMDTFAALCIFLPMRLTRNVLR